MGLALEEPSADDTPVEASGVPFLVPADIRRWLDRGRPLVVDWNPWWETFSVRIGGYSDCC